MKNGLIQLYTGDGKGKTTAAIGLAIRALGRGFKVTIVQFLKNQDTGELLFINNSIPELKVIRFNSQKKFTWDMDESEINTLKEETLKGFETLTNLIQENECDLLILDEIVWAINQNFVPFEDFKSILSSKPNSMEIILTGRSASRELIETADLVTEMKKIKHPYDQGIKARIGIEK